MKVAVLDDYQGVVRTLACWGRLAGHDVTVHETAAPDLDALVARLADAQALLLIRERTAITRQLLERTPKLRLISLVGPVPHIDLEACADLGVTVCSSMVPARPSYSTAELTWGLVLAAWRRIPQEMAHLQAGGWQSPQAVGHILRGKTLGIYGYGRIGSVVAGYGAAFGMKVAVWGRSASLSRSAADGFHPAASSQEFFASCDVLSLHLPLDDTTRGIVRADQLSLMKPTALLVNTSRAGLIEAGALAAALSAGRPGLAAVDVFDEEPVFGAHDRLLHLPNVVATPHLGYVVREGLEPMLETMFEQVLAFERGEPINIVQAPGGPDGSGDKRGRGVRSSSGQGGGSA
jgi:D-3-phosphoglycerate dehydrogenase